MKLKLTTKDARTSATVHTAANGDRRTALLGGAQKLVDRRPRPRLLVYLLDYDRRVQAVAPVGRRQAAGDDDRSRRDPAGGGFAGFTIVDACALTQKYAHADDRALLDDDALDHFGAGADETAILDDGRIGL